jgi:nucleoid DNA-binding protein
MSDSTKVKPPSKSEIIAEIGEITSKSKKEVAAFFDALNRTMARSLKRNGMFIVPGLIKISTIRKPATKATTKPNPFKPGETMEVKAKPARSILRIRPLKNLKEMV